VQRLLQVLDERMLEALARLTDLDAPYVEFPDNLHGLMTNPRLFRKYCLSAYQKYTDVLHGQDKFAGSHTDGNVLPLLALLKESQLDVCESFSPYPLTACTLDEAAAAWGSKPIIWGGLPTPLLDETTPQADFEAYLEHIFAVIQAPLILGAVDLFMRHNRIERLEQAARWAESVDPAQLGREKARGN
jgi:hypothetical protein